MVSSIGSTATINTNNSTGPSRTGIEREIAQYKKELSNCLTCESAQTKQGQADIQQLTNKISIAEAKLNEIAHSTARTSILPSESPDKSILKPATNSANSQNTNSNPETSAQQGSDSQSGQFVDLYV